jgi:hypothetical protein
VGSSSTVLPQHGRTKSKSLSPHVSLARWSARTRMRASRRRPPLSARPIAMRDKKA